MKYRVICEKRDQEGKLLNQWIHDGIDESALSVIVEISLSYGADIKEIIEIKD